MSTPPPEQPKSDWFSRMVQITGYLMIVGVIVFWAITDRVSVPVIGAATTMLVYDAGRTALRSLGQRVDQ
jgi:hypothetical protein